MYPKQTYHSYQKDKDFEEKSRSLFDNVYRTYMQTLTDIEVIKDRDLQLRGHDVHLHFQSGKVVVVDEKIRRQDRNDILIEHTSNDQTGRAGWIFTNESAVIAYLFPTNGIWFLRTKDIKEWVMDRSSDFWSIPDLNPARNQKPDGSCYNTLNKAVPLSLMEQKGFVYHKILGVQGMTN